jgi:phage terminase large subunit-like protein
VLPSRNSVLTTMATSAGSSQGKNASCLIMDEVHEWKDRGFFDSLLYADAARINSLVFMITTAGDRVISICYEEYARAKRIIEGKDISIDHLCVIYEADAQAKIDDLEQWKKANPSYGVTLPERKIQRSIDQAKGSPERVAALKRLRLNIWTSPRNSWLDVHKWDAQDTFTEADAAGLHCFAGLDLARVFDIAAFTRLFQLENDRIGFLFRLWVPEDVIPEKIKSDKIPLQDWIDRGFVIATPGDVIDYHEIRRQIVADHKVTPIDSLGFDPHNAEMLCNNMLSAKDGINVATVPQTMPHMSAPSTEFERLLIGGKLPHDHNPALSWMINNVVVYRDTNDNIRPMKGRSFGRIDGVTAAITALNRKMSGDVIDEPDFYNERGVEFL